MIQDVFSPGKQKTAWMGTKFSAHFDRKKSVPSEDHTFFPPSRLHHVQMEIEALLDRLTSMLDIELRMVKSRQQCKDLKVH
jgi:hypothetical protein